MANEKDTAQQTPASEEKDDELEKLKKELAALKKENSALKKDLEEEKQKAEAAPPAPVPVVDDGEERVTIRLFKDGGKYKDDVFVAVNGETCVVKRGVPVQIKKKFAEVLERSMKQDEATAALIERESTDYAEQAKRYNV